MNYEFMDKTGVVFNRDDFVNVNREELARAHGIPIEEMTCDNCAHSPWDDRCSLWDMVSESMEPCAFFVLKGDQAIIEEACEEELISRKEAITLLLGINASLSGKEAAALLEKLPAVVRIEKDGM